MEKIIHYCWFGGRPLPPLAKKCIRSWKKCLPGFKIVQWDETNFDVNINGFCAAAYEQKKWAFVADVARCHALREYGGMYLDTDMLLKKGIENTLDCEFMAGWESPYNVAAGIVWCAKPHHPIMDTLFDYYENNEFDMENVYSMTIPRLLTSILQKDYGLVFCCDKTQELRDGVRAYARDYFYPIPSDGGENMFTENTCAVHYYIGSWLPDSERKRIVFRLKLGRGLGDAVLNFLVFGKRVLRSVYRVVFYPYRKYKQKKCDAAEINRLIGEFDENVRELEPSGNIVFYNKNWFGTSIATKELFDNTVGIDELNYKPFVEHIADYIISTGYRLVIFSAFSYGWDSLVKELKQRNPEIVIKVLWHGSLALLSEYYDWVIFNQLVYMHTSGVLDSIGFVKKSMYEFFLKKGFRAEFVANRVSVEKPDKPPRKPDGTVRIGLYASGDRWVKNFYNQLGAASLFENAVVDCIPLSEKTVILSNTFDINMTGSYVNKKRSELLAMLASNDVNLYVTFTECGPLLPLESLALGVPCITGNNHHYWQGTPLEEYLVVNRPDDCVAIYEKAKYCIEHRDEIMRLYSEWTVENDRLSRESVESFLTIPEKTN